MSGLVQIVCGGQYGSEAKGAIAAHLCEVEEVDIAVRTGATNAGHTVVHNGVRHAMQQLPVGWVNPNTILVLGAGAIIDLDILAREIKVINAAMEGDVRQRIYIDPRAYIHKSDHAERSALSGRHHTMGATGKGCSEALTDRIKLRAEHTDGTLGHYLRNGNGGVDARIGYICGNNDGMFIDTEGWLNYQYDKGAHIQLEATQGQLLDLCLGPYPYVTHKQTGPAQWLLESGLSPNMKLDIVMVVRTYPIRVAGNSGPMMNEISWPELARDINEKRADIGMDPIVSEDSIQRFENAVKAQVAQHTWKVPFGSNGLDQHRWTDRYSYRVGLSEIHKSALDTLDEITMTDLRRLFEMTTVTKKLRRVARLSMADVAVAARQVRPHRLAVTFLNYEFPERWYSNEDVTGKELAYLENIENACAGRRVAMVSRGPNPEHIVAV
jgi:adenylosuccinate synthase